MQPNLATRYIAKGAHSIKKGIKDGDIGVSKVSKPNRMGGTDSAVRIKYGKGKSSTIPTGKAKRYAKELGSAIATVGKMGAAMASEPFTNKRLKESLNAPIIRRRKDSQGNPTYSTE